LLAPYRSTAGYARRSRLAWSENPLPQNTSHFGDTTLVVRDLQRALEVFGEFFYFVEDFLRLFSEIIDHAIDHFRLATDEFERGDHKGQVVIDIVPQVGKFPVYVSDLLGAERDSLSG
jgi:hypothetical protein